ncbi:hypothetical protein HYX16_04915 [Candidatus Woesearchaeota archaeon]|nr:hypothetical protein [Candidatus Woesearchaeota archaeon]
MILDLKIDEEIRRAVRNYREILKDYANLSLVSPDILDEFRAAYFRSEFIGLARIENREKRAIEELKLYSELKNCFAWHIGKKIFENLRFSFKIPKEACIVLGNTLIDYASLEDKLII